MYLVYFTLKEEMKSKAILVLKKVCQDTSYKETGHLEEELFSTNTLLRFHSSMECDQMGQLEEV